jgi:hypothetical protein
MQLVLKCAAKGAATGGTLHCRAHGGGLRCQEADCFNLAVVRSVHCRLCLKDASTNNTSL